MSYASPRRVLYFYIKALTPLVKKALISKLLNTTMTSSIYGAKNHILKNQNALLIYIYPLQRPEKDFCHTPKSR